jgi:hypothetical protein
VVILIGGDWVQLSDVDHELQRYQWIESCVERYVYRGTSDSIDEEDGTDFSSSSSARSIYAQDTIRSASGSRISRRQHSNAISNILSSWSCHLD